MVSAKRIESISTMYRVFGNGSSYKIIESIFQRCIESLTMVSAKRIESFDFATMYRVFNNGFS